MKRLVAVSAVSILILMTMTLDCTAGCLPITKEGLILESQYVFHGIVTDVISSWTAERSMIYTYVTLEVLDVYKGELGDEVVMQLRGGLIDGKGILSTDQPELEEGMEVIVHALLLDSGYLYHKGCEKGVYYVKDEVISDYLGRLVMPLDEFRDFVNKAVREEEKE
jgi:hypothetical protein